MDIIPLYIFGLDSPLPAAAVAAELGASAPPSCRPATPRWPCPQRRPRVAPPAAAPRRLRSTRPLPRGILEEVLLLSSTVTTTIVFCQVEI